MPSHGRLNIWVQLGKKLRRERKGGFKNRSREIIGGELQKVFRGRGNGEEGHKG